MQLLRPLLMLTALSGCREVLLTGPVDPPDTVMAMLGVWDYEAEFEFEKFGTAGDMIECTVTNAVLHISEPIHHDEGFLSSSFRPSAAVPNGTMQCTGAASFTVALGDAVREPSSRSSYVDLEVRFRVLTPIGTVTVSSVAWRDGLVAGDVVTRTAWQGRVWAANNAVGSGHPSAANGNFSANKR